MALESSEAMAIGRLQQAVEGLERTTAMLAEVVKEMRDEFHGRMLKLETAEANKASHEAGLRKGFTMGQRSAAVVAILLMLLGAKKGADWMIEQVITLLSLGK